MLDHVSNMDHSEAHVINMLTAKNSVWNTVFCRINSVFDDGMVPMYVQPPCWRYEVSQLSITGTEMYTFSVSVSGLYWCKQQKTFMSHWRVSGLFHKLAPLQFNIEIWRIYSYNAIRKLHFIRRGIHGWQWKCGIWLLSISCKSLIIGYIPY